MSNQVCRSNCAPTPMPPTLTQLREGFQLLEHQVSFHREHLQAPLAAKEPISLDSVMACKLEG
ncbi:hypothetical protein BD413DRAFT_535095, partial [Trametes elegans]